MNYTKHLLGSLLIMVILVSCSNNHTLFRIQENGLYGFIDSVGQTIIAPQYKYVSHFSEDGYAFVINNMVYKNDSIESLKLTYGYINKKNHLVIDTTNTIVLYGNTISRWFDDDIEVIVKNFNSYKLSFSIDLMDDLYLKYNRFIYQDPQTLKFGFKDVENNICISPIYKRVSSFNNNLSVVTRDLDKTEMKNIPRSELLNQTGVIDPQGKIVVEFEYSIIQNYNKNGKTWACVGSVSEELDIETDWVLINDKGLVLTGPIPGGLFTTIPSNNYNSDIYTIKFNLGMLGREFYSFITEDGKYLTDLNEDGSFNLFSDSDDRESELFTDVVSFSEGFGGVQGFNSQNKPVWWFIDDKTVRQSDVFANIKSFSEGLAPVQNWKGSSGEQVLNGQWGYVNTNMQTAIAFKYDYCDNFKNGLAYVLKNGSSFNIDGYINKQGDYVWQAKRKH